MNSPAPRLEEVKYHVLLTAEIFSGGIPARPKRSMTFASTPHVTGLTKPSGGGGKNDALNFSSCETKVGSPAIQLPITMRPPRLVTRTISFATSNGRGANIAPNMVTVRSKE